MNTDDTDAPTLTANDLAALRMASCVGFHHYGGRAYIVASLDLDNDSTRSLRRIQELFPNRERGERDRRIEVAATFTIYSPSQPVASCFALVQSARYHSTWTTIADLLRVGDRITLHWHANNDSEYLRNAGLHRDQLHLVAATKGHKIRTFHVTDSTTPNNTARMVNFADLKEIRS